MTSSTRRSTVLEDIDILANQPSVVSIKGQLISNTEDSMTIRVGPSLFEIPYQSIRNSEEISRIESQKTVELEIADDAKILCKTMLSAKEAADGKGTPTWTSTGRKVVPLKLLEPGTLVATSGGIGIVTEDGSIVKLGGGMSGDMGWLGPKVGDY